MIRDFTAGIALFARGFGLVFGRPRLLLIGAVPAVVTTALLIGSVVALGYWVDDLAVWVTPFAELWDPPLRSAVRFLAAVSILGAYLAVGLLLFTAITLVVGGPFYEHIAETIEDTELGGVPEAERVSWWRSASVGARDAVLLVGLALLCAFPLFLAGFIPLIGQTVVPVLAVCVNASLLAVELTGIPFTRRGLPLDVRRRVLRRRRALTLGFAVPAYLLCLIPLAALVVMPAAMAGGTVLAHRLLTESEIG
ncbi:CysZ protein [Saccharothrix coeruleofusca]|uniref:EI24 domain-containing protein n=1 Tax=Saccharothrix coeruleofusca TaxID=33919 RepID=UPI001AE27D72|nr:EI24 domain-containing protein [Saccharothrix coeruleofusca]MBP2338111.1 CysZ protein [Saccharothrix coeruleofusca]